MTWRRTRPMARLRSSTWVSMGVSAGVAAMSTGGSVHQLADEVGHLQRGGVGLLLQVGAGAVAALGVLVDRGTAGPSPPSWRRTCGRAAAPPGRPWWWCRRTARDRRTPALQVLVGRDRGQERALVRDRRRCRIRRPTRRRRRSARSAACPAAAPGCPPRARAPGCWVNSTPISRPPLEPPWMPSRRGQVILRAIRSFATAAKSS